MLKISKISIRNLPTPLAGLALGIASIGWSLENALPLQGVGQNLGATIAALLLCSIALKFLCHPDTLLNDLQHPVIGSIVPTFAMGCMIVSKALGNVNALAGESLWLVAVFLHLMFLLIFFYHRSKTLSMHHILPSWFVPPVGIIVADVASPGGIFTPLALTLLYFGLFSYLIMLPIMLYRFMFHPEIPDAAKPTIAIMAAPASLSLAGYLTVESEPSLLLCAILLGIALLMTLLIYIAFFRLLKLPFSPGYAAFTFPMAIGATALYKVSDLLQQYDYSKEYAQQLHSLATVEVTVATILISYVVVRYLYHYLLNPFFPPKEHTGS